MQQPDQLTTYFHEFIGGASADPRTHLAETLLTSGSLLPIIQGSTPEDQDKFVELAEQAYPTVDVTNIKLLTVLGDVCRTINRPSASTVVSPSLKKHGTAPIADGKFMDAWEGEYCRKRVGVKTFRTYSKSTMKEVEKAVYQRVVIWKKLQHTNIAKFYGLDTVVFGKLAFVCYLADNGDIVQYTVTHPQAPRPALLLQVAEGLRYLHSLGIPHGNLKGANILTSRRGRVRLTDYGLASINTLIASALQTTVANSRWLAPEIIRPSCGIADADVESKPADIFAFAMVGVEVFTGMPPFEGQGDTVVVAWICRGDRPAFPQDPEAVHLTVQMQQLLERCWSQEPTDRPEIDEVVRTWRHLLGDNEYVQ